MLVKRRQCLPKLTEKFLIWLSYYKWKQMIHQGTWNILNVKEKENRFCQGKMYSKKSSILRKQVSKQFNASILLHGKNQAQNADMIIEYINSYATNHDQYCTSIYNISDFMKQEPTKRKKITENYDRKIYERQNYLNRQT